MESNWRWNVYASGWQNKAFNLVARLVTPLFGFNALATLDFGSFYGLYLGIADTQGYVPTWGFYQARLNPGFPYGFVVVPDTPAIPWV